MAQTGAAASSSWNMIMMHGDSRERYKSLEEVKDGRVCVRKGEQKRRRIRHDTDSFAAQMLPE
jgi:hypothetical protein